jgi:anti-sigma28 factor (negative regulator of flagellin synthesis)
MSALAPRQTPESAVNPVPNQADIHQDPPEGGGASSSLGPTRLQVIHNLVRSGDYHVSADEIADRMIEQLMIARREYDS